MNKRLFVVVAVVVFAFAAIKFIFAEGAHKYIGVKKCAMCHKSEAKGNQYGQWLSTKHAKAYESLGTDAAKETAKKAGVSGNPQEAPECLRCHTTAYGVDASLLDAEFKKEDGVQCEACHGAGNDYKSLGIMKDKAQAAANGLIIPTEEVCVKCHNAESPKFGGFDYKDYYQEIAHPMPKS